MIHGGGGIGFAVEVIRLMRVPAEQEVHGPPADASCSSA